MQNFVGKTICIVGYMKVANYVAIMYQSMLLRSSESDMRNWHSFYMLSFQRQCITSFCVFIWDMPYFSRENFDSNRFTFYLHVP